MSALKGQISVIPQEIFQVSTTQNTDLGAQASAGDGRIFRYCLAGTTALVAGNLLASQGNISGLTNLATLVAGTLTTFVSTSSTVTVTANQLAGGTMGVRTTPGNGLLYRIKSHPAVTAGTLAIILEDPLQVALSTASRVDLIPSPYSAVVVSPTTAVGIPVGIAPLAIPASNYFWAQTRGPVAALADSSVAAVGQAISVSGATAGAITASGGTTFAIGIAQEASVSASNTTVYLTLE